VMRPQNGRESMSAGQVTSRAREGRRLIHLLWLGVPADDQRCILQALHEAGRAVVSQSADQLVGLRDRGLRKSDVLLTDGASSSLSPTAVVEEVAAARCDVPVVVLIDAGHETRVVEWMGRGVRDCVARDKPASIAAVIARESSAVGVRRAFARRGRWLDERKHRSAGLLESFYEVYYRSTLDGIILEISPSVKAQGGYEPEELIGQHVRMVYADESRRDAILDGLRAHGKIQDHPIVLRKKSGELREALLMARLIRDSNGVPVGIEGALRDVTEGRRVAEALRQSEERYRQLVESAADPIFTLDREGRFLFVNGRAADYFGRKATDLVGTEMGEWFPAEMAARQMEGVRTVIETRVSQTFESPSLIRGEEYWFSASISPILDAKGEPIAAQVIARDVTVRRRLELQLRRSEERYRTLVESAGDGIAIVDAQGVCHFANAALGRLFEVEAAALLGVGGGGQLSSEASERLVATVRSVIEAGVGRTIEAPFPLRGTTRWFSVEVRPTDWVGVLGACVRIDVREITELKGAEAALRRERDLARRYLDLAGTMIVLVQSDGRIGLGIDAVAI
jgi:PAS domain S-box-containing protein